MIDGPEGVVAFGAVVGYERKGFYGLDEVFALLGRVEADFDGDLINMGSARYRLFAKSCVCVSCGIEGRWFAKERSARLRKATGEWTATTNTWHFNLYALDAEGGLVMLTKDHIIPRSRGGPDIDDNFQTMCSPCNRFKSNKMPGDTALHRPQPVGPSRAERRREKNRHRQHVKAITRGETRGATLDTAWGGYLAEEPARIAYVRTWLVYGDRLFRTERLVDPYTGVIEGAWVDPRDLSVRGALIQRTIDDAVGFGPRAAALAYLKGRCEAAALLQGA